MAIHIREDVIARLGMDECDGTAATARFEGGSECIEDTVKRIINREKEVSR